MPSAPRWSACLVPLALCACEPAPPAQRTVAPVTAAPPPTPSTPPEAPAPGVMEGAPTARLGALSVDADGTLRDGDRVLDRDVVPELARTPDGAAVVYPRRSETGATLWWRPLPDGAPRALSTGLTFADRPVVHPDGAWVFAWGDDAAHGVAGLYRIALPPRPAAVVRVGNAGVRAVADPRFVPPPVAHDARFVRRDTLVYTGPEGPVTLRVDAPEAP